MTTSTLSNIQPAPRDAILGVTEAYKLDPSPNKVNLGVGIYQDGDGKIPLLNSVQEASKRWLAEENTKAYLPIDGLPSFNTATQVLIFGADSEAVKSKRIATVQSLGGSGALRLAADFIKSFFPESPIFISDPSWENHRGLIGAAGVKVETYPYYDPSTKGLAFGRMLEFISALPERSVILLHACCHNPTGVDLTADQWTEVVAACVKKQHLPIVDLAYQGFSSSIDEDARVVRLLAESGLSFLVASSCAKSFSLYRERVGALSIVTQSPDEAATITSQLKRLVRAIYSNPPSWGASVVSIILNDKELRAIWEAELNEMRERILSMRQLFADSLKDLLPNHNFSFILKQAGMFSYSGLSQKVITRLREKHHIYALDSGRICVAAMNSKNVPYIAAAIADSLDE